MDTDWPVVTRELLIGAISLVSGLVIGLIVGYVRHRLALSRLVKEHEN